MKNYKQILNRFVTCILIFACLTFNINAANDFRFYEHQQYTQGSKQLIYDPPVSCVNYFRPTTTSNYRGTYATSAKFTYNGVEKYQVIVGYNSLDNVARQVKIDVWGVDRFTGNTVSIYYVDYGTPTRALGRTVVDFTCGSEYTYIYAMVRVRVAGGNSEYAFNEAESSIDPFPNPNE